MLESFFIYGDLPSHAEKGVYQLPLVILSYMVASFASYTALSLAQNLVEAKSRYEKYLLHWGGAFAMGAGIWSMHFIGMLSYKMNMLVKYDPSLTLLSMFIAIAVAYGVLEIVARDRLTIQKILIGGVLLGLGICGMHYTGMAAMKMDGDLRYKPGLFSLSVGVAIAASASALFMAFTLARHAGRYRDLFQIGAALIMGAAICGMHYTGMLASVIIPWANCRYDPNQDFNMLAVSVAITTAIILQLALFAGLYRKRQTEFQLQNSESKLRSMIEGALDAVISMDQKGLITEWNKQAEIIFGWPSDEAIGKPMAEMLIPPEYRDAHHQGMQRFLTHGIGPLLNKRIEVPAINKRGTRFPIELTITAQKLHDKTYQFTAFLRDITVRKRAEEATALLASIVESSEDAIVSKTLDGVITSWNFGAENLFGYSVAEAVGKNISFIIPPERIAEEQQIIAKLREGQSVQHFETERLKKGGQLINISLTVSPIRNALGQVVGASKIGRDITARKEAEMKLLRYTTEIESINKDLEDFSYVASHDLKEPLRGIYNFSQFLLDDYKDTLDAEGKSKLYTLQKLSKRMQDLIDNLLEYSRIGREEKTFTKTDLNQVLHDTLELMGPDLKEKNASVNVKNDLPVIVCDKVRVAEIFRNLIMNAVKYNESERKIIEIGHTKTHQKAWGKLLFFIKDNGIGIPEKHLETVFKMFKRLHARDAYGGGTGSGLAIVKKVIERHNGAIWAESDGKNGTTFYFTLSDE